MGGWNKGLTKETDERVRKLSERAVVTRKKRYVSGELVHWSKGKTKETNAGVRKISESRKKGFSEGRIVLNSSVWRKGNKSWNEGLTKEIDSRVRLSGQKLSETRLRLSREGNLTSWNKGLSKKDTPKLQEIGKKISARKLEVSTIAWNRNLTKETSDSVKLNALRCSETKKRRYALGEYEPCWAKGQTKYTDIRLARSSERFLGEKNPSWQGGISNLPYDYNFTPELKEKIKCRDNYRCALCSVKDYLYVHHIDYNKMNSSERNLITLCCACNFKVNTKRKIWTEFFQMLISLSTHAGRE